MTWKLFFSHEPDMANAATLLSIHHFILMGFGVLAILIPLKFSKKIRNHPKEKILKIILAIVLILLEIGYHIHNWYKPMTSVPLHICSFAVFLNVTLLLTDSKRVFEYAFFFGILGGLLALYLPDTMGFPYYNFRYYHFLILHSLLIVVPLYYYKAYGYRVDYKITIKVFKAVVITGIVIYIINSFIGTNYWFVTKVPSNVQFVFKRWNVYIVCFSTLIFLSMIGLTFFSNYVESKQKKNS